MYEVINKELGIKACGLADLKGEQVNCFLKPWESDATIGTLTLFFELETGDLVLNKDNKEYETYLGLAEAYLGSSSETRKEIWKQEVPNGLKETLLVLENCLKHRRIEQEIFRAKANYIDNKSSHMVLNGIIDRYNNATAAACIAFRYGIMQGKRMERAKKKRQSLNFGE